MFKKSIAILVVVMLLFSGTSSYALIPYYQTGEVTETEVPYGLLEELNILNIDEYKTLDTYVTKGMFLKWSIQMIGMNEANIPSASKQIFLDVPVDSKYAALAEFGYNRGIVVGNGIGSLEAENVVSVNDAVVMAVRAAGYNVENTLMLRAKNEVLDDLNPSEQLTSKSAMEILWNTLSLNAVMLGADGYYVDNSQTLLNHLFRVYTYSGVVDDDGVININSGTSTLNSDQISLEGVVYQAEEGKWTGLAGYNVNAYIREENGAKKVLFINPIDNEVKILKTDTVVSYVNGVIELDDKKKLKVSETAKNIWNFDRVYMENGELKLPEDGTIVAVDNNTDNNIDCVFIYNPQYGTVVEVDDKDNVLYVNQGVSKVYELNEYESCDIYNYIGEKISFDEITADALAEIYISKNQTRMVAFVQKNIMEYTVSTLKEVDGKNIAIVSDGSQLVISPHFESMNAIALQTGATYQMTFDSDGRIAVATEIQKGNMTYGYLFSYSSEGLFQSDVTMAIYSINDEMITAKAKDKLKVKENDTESVWTSEALLNKFKTGFTPTLVRYAMDADGNITQIEFPSADRFSNGFRCVGTSGGATSGTLMYDARMRVGSIYMVGGQILLDNTKTKIIVVPTDLSINGDWKIMNISSALKDGKYYQSLKGYGVNPDSMAADVVIMDESKLGYADTYNLVPGLISGFEETYDAKTQEKYSVVRLYQNGSEVALRLDEDVKPQYTVSTTGEVIDLEIGDVIRVVKDSNDRVISFKLLFDESTRTCYGANDVTTEHLDKGYGVSQRTNYGTPHKIIGNAMYIIKDGETTPSSDIFRTDIDAIYEFDPSRRNPISIITANDIETLSDNAAATNKVFIQLSYSKSLITVLYK